MIVQKMTPQQEESVKEVIENVEMIVEEPSMPKNLKIKLNALKETFVQGGEISITTNKALAELDDIANNPNLDQHIRTQIWNIVSLLEKVNGQ
ncbi:MAG: UPF0147 family protein [Nanoarchaeota archaeon]|nr:UPF0147 family protein [Nanoarchaeota archaeon]